MDKKETIVTAECKGVKGSMEGHAAMKKEINDFAVDVYDYIFPQLQFHKPKSLLNLKLPSEKEVRDSPFKECMGKGIIVSQLMMREYFRRSLDFTFCEATFKHDVMTILSLWIKERENVFVSVIDSLAIIAEVFLYCDCYKDFDLNLSKASDWFVECFENFQEKFFKNGGWTRFEEFCEISYGTMYEFLDITNVIFSNAKYQPLSHDCRIIQFARLESPVGFPMLRENTCKRCEVSSDEMHNTVYVRMMNEVVAKVFSAREEISVLKGKDDLNEDVSELLEQLSTDIIKQKTYKGTETVTAPSPKDSVITERLVSLDNLSQFNLTTLLNKCEKINSIIEEIHERIANKNLSEESDIECINFPLEMETCVSRPKCYDYDEFVNRTIKINKSGKVKCCFLSEKYQDSLQILLQSSKKENSKFVTVKCSSKTSRETVDEIKNFSKEFELVKEVGSKLKLNTEKTTVWNPVKQVYYQLPYCIIKRNTPDLRRHPRDDNFQSPEDNEEKSNLGSKKTLKTETTDQIIFQFSEFNDSSSERNIEGQFEECLQLWRVSDKKYSYNCMNLENYDEPDVRIKTQLAIS